MNEAAGNSGAAFVFDLEANALASFRNAGTNPASYFAPAPRLGLLWTPSVDLAGTSGHSSALLVGYLTPLNLVFGAGQVLLVNVADPAGRLFMLGPLAGPIANCAIVLPNNIALVGATASKQTVQLGGAAFALSNALDLVLDF